MPPAASPAAPALSTHAMPRIGTTAPTLYAVTLFVSALLVFTVQPMFAKMILPRLGGAPAVWSVAMVFFQMALVAGYAYAHLLSRTLSSGPAAFVHLAVLALASLALPISIASGFAAPPASGVVFWLFALLSASIGLPFVALAASAPLLQSWFAAARERQGANPYVLYAASNLGSFAGLLAYPFLAEPLLPLRHQTWLWALGYSVLAVLIAAAGLLALRASRMERAIAVPATPAPSLMRRLSWIVRASIPAGLVIAVTAYISTDVAAAPFFWVLPLALYLLTFVAVFREVPWLDEHTLKRLVPFAVAPLSISLLAGERVFWLAVIAINLAAFVLLALLCHGALYRDRPQPARLTEFYLWVSIGGVIGGIFAGLLAPFVFSGTYEYPILIAAALLVVPGTLASCRTFLREAGAPLVIAAGAAAARLLWEDRLLGIGEHAFEAALVGLAGLMLVQRRRPARFFGLVVLAFVVTELWQPGRVRVALARSFFGVHQVVETQTAAGRYRVLLHGTTTHGAEQIEDAEGRPVTKPEPLTYYYFGGPISEAIAAARSSRGTLEHVAVIGLGTGSLACHAKQGESWTFFEIDPVVVHLARDSGLFRFMSQCGRDARVVLGDARLTLAASKAKYDLIVLDAFSSDSIPVHLLTREALSGYLTRLSRHGVLVFHLSNRHLDLLPVVAAEAAAAGLVVSAKRDHRVNGLAIDYRSDALAAVLAAHASDMGDLPTHSGWGWVAPGGAAPWTDDYSDLLGALVRKKLGG